MQLNIYIGRENIPKDKILVYDVEDYFGTVKVKDTLINREIIEIIEQGEYISPILDFDILISLNLYLNNL